MISKPTDKPPLRFVASLPVRIEAEWNPKYAHLAGFPLNLVYLGVRPPTSGDGPPRLVSACYWFDPGTYREDEAIRELWYVTREESPYRVCVRHHKRSGAWSTLKYRGDELVASAEGPDFEHAMIQATMVGLAADEPEAGSPCPRESCASTANRMMSVRYGPTAGAGTKSGRPS